MEMHWVDMREAKPTFVVLGYVVLYGTDFIIMPLCGYFSLLFYVLIIVSMFCASYTTKCIKREDGGRT